MFDVLSTVILSVLSVFCVACVWALICNIRTRNQRIRIIDWVYENSETWQNRHRLFNEVTYDQHWWALITFRNPMNLYQFEDFG